MSHPGDTKGWWQQKTFLCSQVNGTDFTIQNPGVLLLIVDACSVPFRLTEKKIFSPADVSRMEEYLRIGIPPR